MTTAYFPIAGWVLDSYARRAERMFAEIDTHRHYVVRNRLLGSRLVWARSAQHARLLCGGGYSVHRATPDEIFAAWSATPTAPARKAAA